MKQTHSCAVLALMSNFCLHTKMLVPLSCVEATEKKNGKEPKRDLNNMEGEEGDE